MIPGTSIPTGLSTLGLSFITLGSEQRPHDPFLKKANSRYMGEIRRIRQSYCSSHQQFVNQGHPEPLMIYWQLMILHRTILPQIGSFLLFHPHSSYLPRLITTLQSNEFSYFTFIFYTFEFWNLQINGPKNKWLLKGGLEKERKKEKKLEARGCPLGTGELSADDLRTILTVETLVYAFVCGEFTGNQDSGVLARKSLIKEE